MYFKIDLVSCCHCPMSRVYRYYTCCVKCKILTFRLLPFGFQSAHLLVRIFLVGSNRPLPVDPRSITKGAYRSSPQSSPRQAWLSAESAAHLSLPSTPLCSSFVTLRSDQMILHKVTKLYQTSWTPHQHGLTFHPAPASAEPWLGQNELDEFSGKSQPWANPRPSPHSQCGLIPRWWGHGPPRQKKVLFPQEGPMSAWLVEQRPLLQPLVLHQRTRE